MSRQTDVRVLAGLPVAELLYPSRSRDVDFDEVRIRDDAYAARLRASQKEAGKDIDAENSCCFVEVDADVWNVEEE